MTTTALPKVQRALLQCSALSTEVRLITDHPVPQPDFSQGEHLIRVYCTAITRGELHWNKMLPPASIAAGSKELVPCSDVAGTVIAAPKDSPFPSGTEVYARASYFRTGCAREYTVLLADEMAARPQSLSWAESACVPMSAETAWQALFVHAGWSPDAGKGGNGKTVFVTAASGGVGVWIVQLAKWVGARVVATCGKQNVERVKMLGADEVFDHQKTSGRQWAETAGRTADLVIDCIGGAATEDAWWTVKRNGTFISVAQDPGPARPKGMPQDEIKAMFFIMTSNGEQLRKINALMEREAWRPALDNVFPFEEFNAAFDRVEDGRATGKVVLSLERKLG